ncbi:MAG TPA: hypothetical protein PLI09_27775 [Candidatus Hydrogenedentes bacterium]|nr:hypothetical protein [Candidatus Hydrogenedentota bacterium]
MKGKHIILGVHVQNRARDAAKVQKILSENGCIIKTRLGLHEVDENFCAAGGVVLLELRGDGKQANALAKQLGALKDIEVKKMVFAHTK